MGSAADLAGFMLHTVEWPLRPFSPMRDPIALAEDALAGVSVEYGVAARMRDGVRLVADVYRPAGTERSCACAGAAGGADAGGSRAGARG